MKVICTYTNHPQADAAEALARYAPETEYCETVGLYGYCDVIEAHWTGLEDLVVVEGDKVVTAETIPSFASCDRPFCGCWTPIPNKRYQIGLETFQYNVIMGIGCNKFTAELQREVTPDEFLHDDGDIEPPCPFCAGRGCWNYLDIRMTRAFMAHGVTIHPHGWVDHKHEYPNVTNSAEITDPKWRAEIEWMDNLAGPAWPYREAK